MKHRNIVGPYVVKGVLIGLFFPLLAIVICVYILSPEGAELTLRMIHKDYPLMWIIDLAPFVLGIISYFVGTNINELNNKFVDRIQDVNETLVTRNSELENVIKEKEVLFKEVHHRVKNNLQVVTSLLRLQSRHVEDPVSKKLFKNCQYRIKSMSMIHEMLYKSQDISKINYSNYIQKLISGLVVSMKGEAHNITLSIEVPEIRLDINTSIPLGLLINEIITNALKYGIPRDSLGHIYLKMTKTEDQRLKIVIGDDGLGFADEVNFETTNSLGLKLINKLTTQLKGSIEKLKDKKGTHYILLFQEIE